MVVLSFVALGGKGGWRGREGNVVVGEVGEERRGEERGEEKRGEREETHSIASRIDNALDAAANGLQGVGADARGALREALDALAGFGGKVLGCLAARA